MAGGRCRVAVLRLESRAVLPQLQADRNPSGSTCIFDSCWGAGS